MLGFGTLAKKVFGTPNDRKLKSVRPLVEQINALEPEYTALSDEGLKDKTQELAERAQQGADLDDLLPEAFANCREAAHRALGLRAFDTQLMAAIFLHQGNIAEQKTGEGKTLTATFAAYLNALTGKGVHVVTVNEYLAKRDADWMGKVFAALGLTTGVIYSEMPGDEKMRAYRSDITYGTNNEFGFDYLRDNMKSSIDEVLQRQHVVALPHALPCTQGSRERVRELRVQVLGEEPLFRDECIEGFAPEIVGCRGRIMMLVERDESHSVQFLQQRTVGLQATVVRDGVDEVHFRLKLLNACNGAEAEADRGKEGKEGKGLAVHASAVYPSGAPSR